jgi:hypothetical protein
VQGMPRAVVFVCRKCGKRPAFLLVAEASNQYYGRIHKDTKILEWNSIQLKQSVMNERLTFD